MRNLIYIVFFFLPTDFWDGIKQALVAIKSLLQLRTTEARVFKDFCALGDALNRMRQLLHDLMADEYQRDYVMDVENLRVEVEHTFQRKLKQS